MHVDKNLKLRHNKRTDLNLDGLNKNLSELSAEMLDVSVTTGNSLLNSHSCKITE